MSKLGIVCNYAKRIIRREIEYRRGRLEQALFDLTFKCNLRCEMCGIWRQNDPRWDRELPLHKWIELIDELAEIGCRRLHLSGGEPTIYNGFVDIIKHAKEKGFYVSLNTNGASPENLIPEICRYTDAVYLSLDAPDKKHDKIRGLEGVFDKTINNIKTIVEYKRQNTLVSPIVNLRAVISRTNHDCIQGLIELGDKTGVDIVSLQYITVTPQQSADQSLLDGKHVAANRFSVDDMTDLLVDEQGIELIRKQMANPLKTNKTTVQLEPMRSLPDRSFLTGDFPIRRCTNISNVIMILPDGSTTICGHLTKYSMGSVLESSLKDIWKSPERKRLMDQLRQQLFPVCKNCTFFSNTLTPGQLLNIAMHRRLRFD